MASSFLADGGDLDVVLEQYRRYGHVERLNWTFQLRQGRPFAAYWSMHHPDPSTPDCTLPGFLLSHLFFLPSFPTQAV